MLIAASAADERVTTTHRAKLAYVYVRQSSLNQVKQHQESTQLQYRLVDRAVALGWPHGRVHVIDDDLGKSGADSAARHGFQKLLAEIGLGNAGLVVSLDASRLARNNRDSRHSRRCLFQGLVPVGHVVGANRGDPPPVRLQDLGPARAAHWL